jgi:hypothetical protein
LEIIQQPTMPPNSITQQRQPTLIPADARLSDEDKRSIKMRTGNIIQTFDAGAFKEAYPVDDKTDQVESLHQVNDSLKRRASTSTEQYHIASSMEFVDGKQEKLPEMRDQGEGVKV